MKARLQAFLVGLVIAIALGLDTRPPALPADAQLGIVNFWVQIGLLIVSYVLQRAFAPRPKAPEVQKADVPRMEDGARVRRIYGTVWIDDPPQLAMQQMDPPDPIRTGGGKK